MSHGWDCELMRDHQKRIAAIDAKRMVTIIIVKRGKRKPSRREIRRIERRTTTT